MSLIIRPNAGFIIPTRRFVEAALKPSAVGMSGRYQLIVRDAWGVEKRRTPWFDNIILDSGLNRWGTGGCIAGAAIGTGTSTPVASQTGLDTQSHWTTTPGAGNGVSSALGSSPYNNTYTAVYRTTPGALNGNYSEVGVGWASGSMFSRALVLDGGGSPTTISVSSSEQLDIVYQLSIFPPLVDTSATVTISGVDYAVTGRGMLVNSITTGGWQPSSIQTAVGVGSWPSAGFFSGSIGAITSSPSGGSGGLAGSGSLALIGGYSNNSLTRAMRYTADLNYGNPSGGVKSSNALWSFCSFQYEFNPVIPKNNTKTLTLDFSVTWARRP